MNTKTCRRRLPTGTAYHGVWLSHDPKGDFACGFSVMFAIVPDEPAEDIAAEDAYSLECRLDNDRIKSWTLTRMTPNGEDADAYVLTGSLSRCNCPHSQYRPHGRPCRHRQALRDGMIQLGYEMPELK